MIKNISLSDLENNQELQKNFYTANFKNLNERCTYLSGNFYLDSLNYYPITEDFKSFNQLFIRINDKSVAHYHSEAFFNNLINKSDKLRVFNDSCVIGSSPGNNYFSNLIHFLPRIFFENEKQVKIVVHRSLSKKFITFMQYLCSFKNVKLIFSYLDDDFYKFENSKIPQFLNTLSSVRLLQSIRNIIPNKYKGIDKIYIRREDANYRVILNEADLIEKLKKNGFYVINSSQYEIIDQISFFLNAKVVLSPYGSGLANIIFCRPGTKILEIGPHTNHKYDQALSKRYENLSKICNLEYQKFTCDSVDVKKHLPLSKKYINENMLNNSNFFKNMILKLSDVDVILKKIQQPTDE